MIEHLNILNPMSENDVEIQRKINEIVEVVNDLTIAFPKYKQSAQVRKDFDLHKET